MMDSLDSLAADPALAAEAAKVRAEWRAEEEEWTQVEVERWVHRRTLVDVAREYLHRGDTVEVATAESTFRGALTGVGKDWLQVLTAVATVDIALTLCITVGSADQRFAAPVVIRRTARAYAGGCRGDGTVATFRARMLEHEASGAVVVVGSALPAGEYRGVLSVGADHVVVSTDAVETALPWVAWVRADS